MIAAAPIPNGSGTGQMRDTRLALVCSRCGSRRVDMVARVKCARSPLLPPRPVHSSDP